jgi:hypothetical protein
MENFLAAKRNRTLNTGGLTKCVEYVTLQKSQAIELRPGRQGAGAR